MDNRIKETFDMIKAEEDLKAETGKFVQEKLRRHKRAGIAGKKLIPAMICMLFIILGGGSWLYFTPTAAVSIDINPSIELDINRFDRVISVNGYNDEGQVLAKELDIRFDNYEDAIEKILNDDGIAQLMEQDEIMSISVAGSDGKQCDRIYSHIESCTRGHKNTRCYSAGADYAEQAHEMGLSCGRYRAYLQLKELGSDITPDEINNMTMREIETLISSMSGNEKNKDAEQDGQSEKGHHGHGGGNQHE